MERRRAHRGRRRRHARRLRGAHRRRADRPGCHREADGGGLVASPARRPRPASTSPSSAAKLVGATLALALAPTRRSVLLIEAVPPDSAAQPSFDDRCSALGNGSRRVLEMLGVWPHMLAAATPIRGIHISDAGHFGAARLEAAELGLDAFGYVVPNRAIGAALWRALEPAPVARRVGARVGQVALGEDVARLEVVDASGATEQVEARVVVAADGAHSLVRAAAGIEAEVQDYHQVAVIANLQAERRAGNIACERFTPNGPLVLPLAGGASRSSGRWRQAGRAPARQHGRGIHRRAAGRWAGASGA
ncbi:MAG: FAD-dependent monooxygenase [Steroidobacteraceae bacterium]